MNATAEAIFPYRFDGKTAIIAEGGSVIGRETARQLARAGARVLVAGGNVATLEETVAQIRNDGGDARHLQADVFRANGVKLLAAAVNAAWGRLDILVNNPANIGSDGNPERRLCDIEEDFFSEVLLAKVRGPWLAMKHAIPLMLKTGGGCVVNVSSSAGLEGIYGRLPFCASSHALLGLTKAGALEYASKGIRINAICPGEFEGAIPTASISETGHESRNARLQGTYSATGRIANVAEVVAPILFLCSDAASNLHGMVLPVDGAFSAQ